jgi:predicted transport protein
MALFDTNENQIKKIKTARAEREKDVQTIFEQNLETILNIYFLETEHPTGFGGRIDSLGIDKDGSPVIIEYKKTQSESIINQGLSYLRWLLDHKDNFEKLVSIKLPNTLNCPINWDNSRVICVAENYNKFDLDTADFLPIKIELLTYALYENGILQVESQNYQQIRIPMAGLIKSSKQETINIREEKLQKSHTIDEHTNKSNEKVKELFFQLREKIKAIDDNIIEDPKKTYIAYKINGTNFTDILFYQNELRIALNIKSGDLDDKHNITVDFSKPKKGHLGNGDYEARLLNEQDIDKVFDLIKQSYEYNK